MPGGEISNSNGINSTAQEHPAFHISHELKLHRIRKQVAIATDVLLPAGIRVPSPGRRRGVPIDLLPNRARYQIDLEEPAGGKMVYVLEAGGE